MSTRTRQVYEITDDQTGAVFNVRFEPVAGSELIKIDGDTARLAYLVDDPDTFEWYFDELEQGDWYGFSRNDKGYKWLEPEEIEAIVKANPGRAFWIEKREHGLVDYRRAGQPCEPWEPQHDALYIAPDDCPDPAAYTDSVMEEFTDWCNGAIYGVCTASYVRAGDGWQESQHEETWGHIGHEWATQALNEAIA